VVGPGTRDPESEGPGGRQAWWPTSLVAGSCALNPICETSFSTSESAIFCMLVWWPGAVRFSSFGAAGLYTAPVSAIQSLRASAVSSTPVRGCVRRQCEAAYCEASSGTTRTCKAAGAYQACILTSQLASRVRFVRAAWPDQRGQGLKDHTHVQAVPAPDRLSVCSVRAARPVSWYRGSPGDRGIERSRIEVAR
jgi:hypothetical protein